MVFSPAQDCADCETKDARLDRFERVIEVGSHRGPLAERLAPRGVTTICVELDTAVVRLAHRPAVQASATHLPFADASADAVTAMNVLYFLARPEDAVAEARRVLRPGGLFVACTQMRENDPELREVAPGWGTPSTFDGTNAEAGRAMLKEHESETLIAASTMLEAAAKAVELAGK